MIEKLIVISLIVSVSFLNGSHFRGGTVTWRPWNATPSGSSAIFLVRERFSWRRSYTPLICYCDDTTIATKGLIGESDLLSCTAGNCSNWTPMSTRTSCTDYSTKLDVSSGERFNTSTFPLNIAFTLYYTNNAWLNQLVLGGGSNWYVACRLNTALRPDGYLNTSPVAVTIPIVYKEINIQQVHVIQMSDFDGTDTLRCRWSNASGNINQYNECGGICMGVPGANLISSNCTIVFTLTVAYKYAGVALQIEDYYSASSTTPMSSVPLQFLFYGYPTPTGCSMPPTIIGERPNRACIGTPIGSNVTENVIVQVGCPGRSIVEFVSTSPIGMKKSTILNPSAGIYQLILSWIPTADQYGPQSFCAGAVDNSSLQSNQWCITFLVGFESPNVIKPTFVQGSASPIGTVFQNQTTFSIQTTKSVNRPTRNGTYIYFWDSTLGGTLVQKYDCGWEPEVTYTGFTTIIRFPVAPWIPGHFYYVTFDYGVASGTEYCGPESPKITDPTYWVFNIWDPAHSSTTTTTTTPMSTATVTTRPTSTTSINTLLTTTGIVITTTTPATTTSQSSTTTSLTTTTGSTVSIVTTEAEVVVIYPTDMESACQGPIIIGTVVMMTIMGAVQAIVMYGAFTKLSNIFNPSNVNTKTRHKLRMKRILAPMN